jgi:D-arabinose 5-phosphate isomerase GutQ
MRSLAMRLMHLGLPVGVVGDMTCGPSGPGTVFVCSAGPGEFGTIGALIDVARKAGASVALFTAHPETGLAARADYVVEVPAQTMTGSRTGQASQQIMGAMSGLRTSAASARECSSALHGSAARRCHTQAHGARRTAHGARRMARLPPAVMSLG